MNNKLLTVFTITFVFLSLVGKAQDLVVGESSLNSWILHAPGNGRTELMIAEGENGTNWNWLKPFVIKDGGSVGFPLGEALFATGNNGSNYGSILETGFDGGQDYLDLFVPGNNANTLIPKVRLKSDGSVGIRYGAALYTMESTYGTILKTGWDGGQDYVDFYVSGNNGNNATPKMRLKSDGRVGIGIEPNYSSPYLLYVAEGIRTEKVKVDLSSNWADYVFAPDYDLMPLSEVATFIQANQHLPEVPSEAELAENGMDLAEMHKIQMQKIEELMLYTLEQQKEIEALKAEVEALKAEKE